MIAVLKTLEPVFYKAGTKIYKELDEFGEITFIQQGEVKVGFKINEHEKFGIRYRNKCEIAAFGVTFNNRSQYIYKAVTYCNGFFIRKEKWLEILNEQDHQVVQMVRRSILVDYMWNFRTKLISQKKKILNHFQLRSDFQNMFVLDNFDKASAENLIKKFCGPLIEECPERKATEELLFKCV